MKRSRNADVDRDDSPPARRSRGSRSGAPFAFKVLCSDGLSSTIFGPDGEIAKEIEERLGVYLKCSKKLDYYPEVKAKDALVGSQRMLLITSFDIQGVHATLEEIMEKIVFCAEMVKEGSEQHGEANDFIGYRDNEYKMRVVLTKTAVGDLISDQGRNIKTLREETGCKIFIDNRPHDTQRMTSVIGERDSLIDAVCRLADNLANEVQDPCFSGWMDVMSFQDDLRDTRRNGRRDELKDDRRDERKDDRRDDRRKEHGSRNLEDHRPMKREDQRDRSPRGHKIFIGGLPPSVDQDVLQMAFDKFGDILETDCRGDGVGFVMFSEQWMADDAMICQDHVIDGSHVDVALSVDDLTNGAGSSNGSNPMGRVVPPPPRNDQQTQTLRGFLDAANDVPQQYLDLDYSITCSLPRDILHRMGGSSGEFMGKVEATTGAKVDVDLAEDDQDYNTVTLIGPLLAVYAGHLMIMTKVNNLMREPEDAHASHAKEMEIASLQQQVQELKQQVQAYGNAGGKRKGPSKGGW